MLLELPPQDELIPPVLNWRQYVPLPPQQSLPVFAEGGVGPGVGMWVGLLVGGVGVGAGVGGKEYTGTEKTTLVLEPVEQ